MGLFGITLKKLEAIPGDLWHDAFGGGNNNVPSKGAPAPSQNGVYQTPAMQQANAVRPPAVAQPPAFNPVLNPPPPVVQPNKKKDDLLHNSVTNFLGTNIVKPVVQPIIGTADALAHVPEAIGREIQNKPINDIQQKVFGTTDPGKIAEKIVGDVGGVGLTALAPGLDSAAEDIAARFLPKAAAKVAGTGAVGSGFGATTGAANGDNAKQLAVDTAGGGVLGMAGRAVAPVLRGAASEVGSRINTPVEDAFHANPAASPEITQANKAAVAQDTKTPVTTPKPATVTPAKPGLLIPKNAPQNTAAAAQHLSDLYDHNGIQADNAHNLINKSIGISKLFSEAGDKLQTAMEGELTPEERTALRDNLEGVASGTGATPKVQAVTRLMQQLNDKGYDVLDRSSKDGVHRVQNYATRVANFVARQTDNPLKNGFNDIRSLFNTQSGFAKSRAIGKYVGSDGEVRYGTKAENGLTGTGNRLVDENGKHFTQTAVSTKELKQNGYDYEDNAGKIANVYHSSVGRVKVAQAAKDELLRDPEHYGLTTTPTKGFEPIRQVPELEGYFAPRNVARKIDDALGHPQVSNLAEKGFQTLTRGVIQSIVYNPLFHGRNLNQLAGLAAGKAKGVFGPAMLKKAYLDLGNMTAEDRAALGERMLSAGVKKETYGADRATVLTNAADKAGLPHISKFSATPMAKLDWSIRSGLFHLVTSGDNALGDEQAAALVNHFLGDTESSGPIARNVGLFWHYMKTRVSVVTDAIKHPNENAGTIVAAAEQAAFLYGATKAFQEWTGNKHASLGHPGVFGLVNEGENIAKGRGSSAATTSLNPVITAALNQLYAKDLYSGQSLNSPAARLKNAEQTLIAPTQNVGKVTAGKASPGQEILQTLTGVSTPHVKGAPSIPNAKNPLAAVLNEKGAKASPDEGPIHDPTGLDQANRYFKAKDAALKAVGNDPEATDVINAFLDKDVNSKGQKVKHDPQQALGIANLLAGTPNALEAVRQFEKSQPNHDPMWDLSTKDLKTFQNYEGTRSSTGEKEAMKVVDSNFNNGQGLTQFIQTRDAYYQNNKFPTGDSVDAPGTPKYPTFQGQQQTDYNYYEANLKDSDPKAKAAYIQAHPDVADALLAVSKYYNDLNVSQGGLAVKGDVELTPAQQQWYNYYNTLPKGTGARSTAIKNNEAMWNSITTALGQSDLINLAKQGAIDQYEGVPFSQKFLKDAKNAGTYDIASNVPLPGGGTGFAFNPTEASNESRASDKSSKASATLSKVIASEKAASQARDAEHASKAANNAVKSVKRNAKLHGPKRLSIQMRGETRVKPFKAKSATIAPRKVNKISLKSNQALKRSNRATLKT